MFVKNFTSQVFTTTTITMHNVSHSYTYTLRQFCLSVCLSFTLVFFVKWLNISTPSDHNYT